MDELKGDMDRAIESMRALNREYAKLARVVLEAQRVTRHLRWQATMLERDCGSEER